MALLHVDLVGDEGVGSVAEGLAVRSVSCVVAQRPDEIGVVASERRMVAVCGLPSRELWVKVLAEAGAGTQLVVRAQPEAVLADIDAWAAGRPVLPVVLLRSGWADLQSRQVLRLEGPTRLTELQARLLRYLVDIAPGVAKRQTLLREVWGYSQRTNSRAVDTAVRRLRIRIDPPGAAFSHLETVHGEGYRFLAPVVVSSELPERQADGSEVAVRQALLVSRLVLVTGPGGAGKTQAAVAAADVLAARYPAGCWVVRCDVVGSSHDLQQRVARALEVSGPPEVLASRLGMALGGAGPALLVLDDLDLGLAGVEQLVAAWHRFTPSLSLLITARERVDWVEHVVQLGAGVGPQGAGGDELVTALIEALALAARQADVAPRELRKRVAERLRLEASEASGLTPQRDSALLEVWRQLDAHDRRLLLRATVFAGPFTLEAADRVLGADQPERLEAMVARSLLVEVQASRNEPVRLALYPGLKELLGADQGQPLELSEVVLRHAAYYAEQGEALWPRAFGPDRPEVHEQLARIADELLVAYWRMVGRDPEFAARLAVALDPHLVATGPVYQRVLLLDPLLANEAALPTPLRAKLLVCRGDAHRLGGAYEAAVRDLKAALQLCEFCQPMMERVVRRTLGQLFLEFHDAAAAEEQLALALALAQADHDTHCEGVVLGIMGLVARFRGRMTDARAAMGRAIALLDAHGDHERRDHISGALAMLDLTEGHAERALARLHEVERSLARTPNRVRDARLLLNMGTAQCVLGRLEQAAASFDDAAACQRRQGNVRGECMAMLNRAWVGLVRGEIEAATVLARRALGKHAEAGFGHGMVAAHVVLALAALLKQDTVGAQHHLTRAGRVVGTDHARDRAELSVWTAAAWLSQGRGAAARAAFQAGRGQLQQGNYPVLERLFDRLEIYLGGGRPEEVGARLELRLLDQLLA